MPLVQKEKKIKKLKVDWKYLKITYTTIIELWYFDKQYVTLQTRFPQSTWLIIEYNQYYSNM